MIKCPSCGSTAQVKIVGHDTYIWSTRIGLYIDYKCGCGKCFTTREDLERQSPKIIKIGIDK